MKKLTHLAPLFLVVLTISSCSSPKPNEVKTTMSFASSQPLSDTKEAYMWLSTTPVRIFAKHSGKPLHGHINTVVNQQPLYADNPGQNWKLLPVNDGTGRWVIYQWHTNKVIRSIGGRGMVQLTDWTPPPSEPAWQDYFDVSGDRPPTSASNSRYASAKSKYQKDLKEFNKQLWNIERVEQGFYVIHQSGLAMDIEGKRTDAHASLTTWDRHNEDNQRFTFVSSEYFVSYALGAQWTDQEWSDLRQKVCQVPSVMGGWKGLAAVAACEAINKGADALIEASKQQDHDAHVREWKEKQKADVEREIKKGDGGQGRPWANDGNYSDNDIRQSVHANKKG